MGRSSLTGFALGIKTPTGFHLGKLFANAFRIEKPFRFFIHERILATGIGQRLPMAVAASHLRELSVVLPEEPRGRYLQASSNCDYLVIHQITGAIFNPRYCATVQYHAFCGDSASEVLLTNRRNAFHPRLPNAAAEDVSLRGGFCGFLHSRAQFTRLTFRGIRGGMCVQSTHAECVELGKQMKKSLLVFVAAIDFAARFSAAAIWLGRYQIALTQEHNSLGSETVCYRLNKFTGTCDVNATSYKGLWIRLHEPPLDAPYASNHRSSADELLDAK